MMRQPCSNSNNNTNITTPGHAQAHSVECQDRSMRCFFGRSKDKVGSNDELSKAGLLASPNRVGSSLAGWLAHHGESRDLLLE